MLWSHGSFSTRGRVEPRKGISGLAFSSSKAPGNLNAELLVGRKSNPLCIDSVGIGIQKIYLTKQDWLHKQNMH